jgi:tetratricopeptide (TPR) repeat protein
MVDSVYDHILGFLEHDPAPQPNVFYVIYRDYLRQGRLEEAMAVINQAGELIPDNVGIRLTLARLYEKSNIRYRAIEEYEKALVIDPLNREARERLDKLQGG